MSIYQKSIIEITGCTPEVAVRLEDIMRHTIFHSTLDWQTKEQFEDAAKEALLIDNQLQAMFN